MERRFCLPTQLDDQPPKSPLSRKAAMSPLPRSAVKKATSPSRQLLTSTLKTNVQNLMSSSNASPHGDASGSGVIPSALGYLNSESLAPTLAWKMTGFRVAQPAPMMTPDASANTAFSFDHDEIAANAAQKARQKVLFDLLGLANLIKGFTMIIDSSSLQVVVQHIDYVNSVWIWAVAVRMGDLVKIMADFSNLLGEYAVFAQPLIMDDVMVKSLELVIAPFEDNYYRARILDVAEDGMCEVIFIDYGNRALVHLSDMRDDPFHAHNMGPPIVPVAFRCKLTGVDYGYLPDKGKAPDVFRDEVEKELSGRPILTGSISPDQPDPDVVEISLTAEWGEDIGTRLRNQGTPATPGRLATREGKKLLPVGPNQVKIRSVESASVVYIWHGDLEEIRAEIKAISAKLEQKFGKSGAQLVTQPERNAFVAATVRGDRLFYRGIVLEVKYDSTAVVQFLDFGSTATLHFDQLYPLDQEDVNTIALALKCHVTWTQPTNGIQYRVNPTDSTGLTEYLAALNGQRKEVLVEAFYKADEIRIGASIYCQDDLAHISMELPPNIPCTAEVGYCMPLPNGRVQSREPLAVVDQVPRVREQIAHSTGHSQEDSPPSLNGGLEGSRIDEHSPEPSFLEPDVSESTMLERRDGTEVDSTSF